MPDPKDPPRSILSNAGPAGANDVVSWLAGGRQEDAARKKRLRKFNKEAARRREISHSPAGQALESTLAGMKGDRTASSASSRAAEAPRRNARRKTGEAALPAPAPDPPVVPLSPTERFQVLMEAAWTGADRAIQVQKAREAVALNLENTEPAVFLAFLGEEPGTPEARIEVCRAALAATEQAVTPESFAGRPRMAWGRPEVRRWVRFHFCLAGMLWEAGRRDEAVTRAQEILRRNAADDLGVRNILTLWLYDLGRDADLEALWKVYFERSTLRAYTRALLAFRRGGDNPDSRRHLKQAIRGNPRIPNYLCGLKPLPVKPSPDSDYWEYDAVRYIAENISRWANLPGAQIWIGGWAKPARPSKTQVHFEAEWAAACASRAPAPPGPQTSG